MSNGFQFIDIIFLAMVAVFLALRLRNVLGRRDGHEGGYRDPFCPAPAPERRADSPASDSDNVIRLPNRSEEVEAAERIAKAAHGNATLADGLTQIKLADPGFDPEAFAKGARGAFEMILEAFAKGKLDGVKPILSPDVLANFEQAVKARHEAGETLENTLVGIRSAEIAEAYMDGRNAVVAVRFTSDQINVTRDREGRVVSGDASAVTAVVDLWTFQRDTRSRDPNWILVATESVE
ncbi:MAG: Tim44 domain-containing protein [Alphaproteobacteria bacterium]|nr:Tim44 domain-containing protein [Alphaproteobacteria bacterium]MBM3952063.1 Tim44 domain-containing protein [Rhodospirillales bacterium]